MLTLYQFEPKYGLPNVSPFCMKVECYLRMANIPYSMQIIKDPRKAPKTKLPFIRDKDKTIADSSFILEYLERTYNVTLDHDLSAQKKGIARALTGALEERLYFALVYSRWIDDANWPRIKDTWFNDLPFIARSFVPNVVRKGVANSLKGHGIALHAPDEIYHIGVRDLQALVDVLGDQRFMLGNSPSSVDAVAFSFVANILYTPFTGPLFDFVIDQPTLTQYCQRMGKTVFSEFAVFQHPVGE
ncbi:MAG: glutathione S-transferase family protein [Pseudomonadota bacterium]